MEPSCLPIREREKEREKGGGTRNQKVFAQPVHISDATKEFVGSRDTPFRRFYHCDPKTFSNQ
jgi:hypothetical protein